MTFYVYFDNDTREIVAISNEKTQKEHSFVEKDKSEVEDFIKGKKNFIDYKFDEKFNFIIKNQQTKDVVSNSFVKITEGTDATLQIIHSKNWMFSFSKQNENINGTLLFAVTVKDNPNKLIRTIYFDSQLANQEHTVDFKYASEQDIENISVWAINPPYETANLEIK